MPARAPRLKATSLFRVVILAALTRAMPAEFFALHGGNEHIRALRAVHPLIPTGLS
jgi:hypothetical protein